MDVIDEVLVLLFLMAFGFAGRKLRVIDDAAMGNFTSLILNISLPALTLVSLQQPFSRDLLEKAGISLALSFGLYALFFALALPYPRLLGLQPKTRGVHRYALIFSNVGFMGYPVVEAVLGKSALFFLAIFNIPFILLAFSVGAWLIAKEGSRPLVLSWRTFINPIVIATLAGFILFLASVRLPYPLLRTLKLTGDTMTPLSMIVIGAVLGKMELRQVLGDWRNYVTVAARLVVMPALVGTLLYLAGIRGFFLVLPTLVTAMPVAANTTLLAGLYEGDLHGSSSMVFLSTLFCLVSIPVVLLVLAGL